MTIIPRLIACFVASLFLFARPTSAAGEFRADYDVQYVISPAGTTIVTQNVTLTNKLTNLYAKEYQILIDSQNIRNVIASDPGGIITPVIGQQDGRTQIRLVFNEQVVGIDKSLVFTLRYEHGDVAHKIGSIWEINIPGVNEDPDLGEYNVTLSVPSQFGPAAFLSPLPSSGRTWTRNQLTKGGISAAYGTQQLFDLTLSYFLQNTGVNPKTETIALPPDTPYQDVAIIGLTPAPVNVTTDSDGNWLAYYTLGPGTRIDIQAKLQVAIRLHPKDGVSQHITPSEYLVPQKYWEAHDQSIVKLAQTYNTPSAIYTYVVNTLSYSYERVDQSPQRKGAVSALATPGQAVCMEFTDLFIAIARAAGIPAREAVGYAYTTNAKLRPLSLVTDVLHAWPEYYDTARQLWVPVDPTWGNTTGGIDYFTKLDFNHIVFAYHGKDSENPYPAGFYKKADVNGKTVQVEFGTRVVDPQEERLSIAMSLPQRIVAGIPTSGTIIVTNLTQTRVDELTVNIQSNKLGLSKSVVQYAVPPFGRIQIPVTVPLLSPFDRGGGTVVVTANGSSSTHVFTILPIYVYGIAPIAAVALGIFIYTLARKRVPWINKRSVL